MSDTFSDPSEQQQVDPHADKYDDPRVKVTPRGLLLAVAVIAFGIIGAAGSIYARRTRLEKTKEFWGQDTITAFQLGERLRMLPISGRQFDPVELTGTPGLGHLRKLLLDERNYDWSSVSQTSIDEHCGQKEAFCVQLRITDPTANRFQPIEVTIDLQSGWLGNPNSPQSVQIAERKQNALRKFLEQLINVQQLRYDHRK